MVNNAVNTSKLTSANLSKSPCMIHLNTLLFFNAKRGFALEQAVSKPGPSC